MHLCLAHCILLLSGIPGTGLVRYTHSINHKALVWPCLHDADDCSCFSLPAKQRTYLCTSAVWIKKKKPPRQPPLQSSYIPDNSVRVLLRRCYWHGIAAHQASIPRPGETKKIYIESFETQVCRILFSLLHHQLPAVSTFHFHAFSSFSCLVFVSVLLCRTRPSARIPHPSVPQASTAFTFIY